MRLHLVLRFPYWWYYEIPRQFFRIARSTFLFLDRDLALTLMLKLWLAPVFGDPTIIGHFIGFVFRTIRIVLGGIILLLSQLAILFYLLLWLSLPFLIFSRASSLGFLLLSFWFIFYIFSSRRKSARVIPLSLSGAEEPLDFAGQGTRNYLKSPFEALAVLPSLLFKDKVVREIVLRLGFLKESGFLEDLGIKREKLVNYPLSEVLQQSLKQASDLKDPFIAPYHLFLSLLKKCDYKTEDILEIVSWRRKNRSWHHVPLIWEEGFVIEGSAGSNRSWQGRVTPHLNKFGSDLTLEAQAGRLPILVGKKRVLSEVVRILEKGSKNNAIIVGQPGCGKTSLVFGIAQEIISGTRSPALADRRLFSLEVGKLIAGAQNAGDLQERMVSLIKDIEESGNIILFIDEIQNAVSAGGGVDTSLVFAALEPHLIGGNLQVIGATSWKNYRRYIEPNEAFARLFDVVEVPEASLTESLEVLELLSFDLEKKYRVTISFPALKSAVELSARFIYDRVLPDKAVDLLEESVADVAKRQAGLVLNSDVEKLITEKTNIPVAKINLDESESLLNLESRMHERLIDQEEAVSAIADSIRRARVGLRDEKRPIVSLLFVGPTGVGKTETAKTLAETFFGKEESMIRFDMSEYQNQESISSLIERLTEAVRRSPFSLVLFDELEKSHPKILDIFLQVLEDGRLTDANGLTVSFSNSIIVFTSNAGTTFIFSKLREGRKIDDFRQDLLTELEKSFRIELLNRFDGVVVFKPLESEHMEMITRLKLRKITAEMEKNGISLTFTDSLVRRLAEEGFDAALGARPLRRLIQDKIESVLAKRILRGELKKDESAVISETVLGERF